MAWQVGPTETLMCEKGVRYLSTFYVTAIEKPTYLQPYGTDVSTLVGKSPATVYLCADCEAGTREDGEAMWLVTIVSNNYWSESLPRLPSTDFFQKSYSVKPYHMPLEWFGMRRATASDIYVSDTATTPKHPGRPKNAMGTADADIDDMIFINYAEDSALRGDINIVTAPITIGDLTKDNIVNIAAQEWPALNCTLEFIIPNAELDAYATFIGVSGNFPSDPNLIPIKPVAGVWRAVDQVVTYYKQGDKNYTKVKRIMEMCPLYQYHGCIWDYLKCGSTWTWGV